jgi:hypothetical protein
VGTVHASGILRFTTNDGAIMGATNKIASHHNTYSIGTDGTDKIVTRNYRVRVRNLSAQVVSFSEIAGSTGGVAAGQQSSIEPVTGTGNKVDDVFLWPNTTYYIWGASSTSLVACDEESAWPGE